MNYGKKGMEKYIKEWRKERYEIWIRRRTKEKGDRVRKTKRKHGG